MDALNFEKYLNKPVKITLGVSNAAINRNITATLSRVNEHGIFLSQPEDGAHSSDDFNVRFYPWTAIEYLDFDLSRNQERRTA